MANLIALMVHCLRGRKASSGRRPAASTMSAWRQAALGGIAMVPVANLETGAMD
jgi:hypothetical protein